MTESKLSNDPFAEDEDEGVGDWSEHAAAQAGLAAPGRLAPEPGTVVYTDGPLPFLPRAWWAADLPVYRDGGGTYDPFSYEALPPISEPLEDNFDWLRAQPPQDEWALAIDADDVERKLPLYSAQSGLTLPSAFTTFLRSPDLPRRLRSVTACYVELSDAPVSVLAPEPGWLIHFLSDQQYCLHWNLFVGADGSHCVLCSFDAYGIAFEENATASFRPLDLTKEKVWVCTPSFSEFLYRYWLETEIWFALTEEKPLTMPQQVYLEHYRGQNQAGKS